MDPIVGIDISHYQWRQGVPYGMLPRLHRAGVRFLIARATIGTVVDRSFEPNRARGTYRGWVPGAYHFLYPGVDAEAQAEAYMEECARTGGIEGLLTVLDVEYNRGDKPTLRDVRTWARTWKDAHPRHQLGLYSNRGTWGSYGNPDITELGFDYAWNAYWPQGVKGPDDLPARPPVAFGGEGRAPLWQWGSLEVKSMTGNTLHLDGNAWYGTMDDLRALSVRERPPLVDRPAYRAQYNATLTAALQAIDGLQAPAGATPVQRAGHDAAKDAATSAVSELTMEVVV